MTTDRRRILAISGSLRRASSNTALIGALAQIAPAGIDIAIYQGLAALPAFNPDFETGEPPAEVAAWRAQLRRADAVLISSPEYAHGVPGSLKNALDWVVGSGELMDKPVALVNASARARHAWMSLAETLVTMSARLIRDASITVNVQGRPLDAIAIAHDLALSAALRGSLDALLAACRRPAA